MATKKTKKSSAASALTGKARPKTSTGADRASSSEPRPSKARLAVWVDPELFKAAKIRAVEEGRPLGVLVEEALGEYLRR